MIGNTATDIASITGTAAGTVAAPIAGAAIAGTGAMTAATATALVGGGIALVTLAVIAFLNRKGPKQKVATTQMVNEVEPLLKRNVDEYLAGPRTPESQAQALKNFDDVWTWLTSSQACGSPDMGNPGKACISDRSRGGKWDWHVYYRDPIANDVPVQATAASVLTSWLPGELQLQPADNKLWLGAGLLLLGMVMR
jgi:hypothetical protein